jgi:hypothetical protein
MVLEPVFGGVYGISKVGKTTDCLYSFPGALFIAHPGALAAHTWIGIPKLLKPPRVFYTISEVTEFLLAIKSKPRAHPNEYSVVVIDDLSLLSDCTVGILQAKGFTGVQLWGELHRLVLNLRLAARRLGGHVIFNAHESQPGNKKDFLGNTFWQKGGPRLSGKLSEQFPAACDTILRCTSGAQRDLGWRGAYSFASDDFIVGDRYGVAFDGCPMNLGEAMRSAGFYLPRLAGLDWQEAVVESCSKYIYDAIKSGTSLVDTSKKMQALIRAKYTQESKYVAWTMRDAVDRAVIRIEREKGTALKHFG